MYGSFAAVSTSGLSACLRSSSRAMNAFPSALTLGPCAGNSTVLALRIVPLCKICSWLWSCPNGRRPYSIWYRITPHDHASTLEEILGGAGPVSKHSGGRYQYVPAPGS